MAGNNIRNECVGCVKTPQNQSQQATQPDTAVHGQSSPAYNWNVGDRVALEIEGKEVEATLKQIKTESDEGQPLPTPITCLSNGTSVPAWRLKKIA